MRSASRDSSSSTTSGKLRGKLRGKNQFLTPKVAIRTDSSSAVILQDNPASDNNGIKDVRDIHSTPEAKNITKDVDAEKFGSGEYGSMTKAVEDLLSLKKISESPGSSRLRQKRHIQSASDQELQKRKGKKPRRFDDFVLESAVPRKKTKRTDELILEKRKGKKPRRFDDFVLLSDLPGKRKKKTNV